MYSCTRPFGVGRLSTSLIASADQKRVVIHSQWRDAAAVAAMRSDPRMVAYFPKLAALASFDSIIGEVAYVADALIMHGIMPLDLDPTSQ